MGISEATQNCNGTIKYSLNTHTAGIIIDANFHGTCKGLVHDGLQAFWQPALGIVHGQNDALVGWNGENKQVTKH